MTSYFSIPVPYNEKDIFFFLVLVLEGLVGLHRMVPLQLLQHYWSGHQIRSVAQSCPTLSDPIDCSLPGSSVYGIFQARVLEWVAIAFSD